MDPLDNVAGMIAGDLRGACRRALAAAAGRQPLGWPVFRWAVPVAALVSHLEPVDAVALYTPIRGVNAMIAQHLPRWGETGQGKAAAAMMGSDVVTALTSVIDPLNAMPTPPPERRLIVGAWYDQMAMREPALVLHERYGGQLYWHDGGHVGHCSPGGCSGSPRTSCGRRWANRRNRRRIRARVWAISASRSWMRGTTTHWNAMPNTAAVMSFTAAPMSMPVATVPSCDALSQSGVDLCRAALQLGPDPVAQRRGRLDRLEGGDEHRPQQFGVLVVDLLDPVEVREHLLHAGVGRVGVRVEVADVFVQERLQDGVLAAVAGMHHGPAVAGTPADLGSCRCLPAFFDDQLGGGLQHPPVRDLDALGLGQPACRGRHPCILDDRQLT